MVDWHGRLIGQARGRGARGLRQQLAEEMLFNAEMVWQLGLDSGEGFFSAIYDLIKQRI